MVIENQKSIVNKSIESDPIDCSTIAVSFIGSKNVSRFVRQLLLTIKEEDIKELLIAALGHHNNLELANIDFLDNLTSQHTFRIQNSIANTRNWLKKREEAKTPTKRRKKKRKRKK